MMQKLALRISAKSIFTALTGIIFVSMASMALVELSGRISAKAFVSKKIDKLEKIVFSRTTNNIQIGEKEVEIFADQLKTYQAIIDDLDHLSFTGARNPYETIYAIRTRLTEFSKRESRQLQVSDLEDSLVKLENRMYDNLKAREITEKSIREQSGYLVDKAETSFLASLEEELSGLRSIDEDLRSQAQAIRQRIVNIETLDFNAENDGLLTSLNTFLYLPSDLLLAFVMVICGGVGSILSSFRSARPQYAHSIFNGILAGFVAFLVVKGGKFLFLINLTPEATTFINPFAAAFTAVMAGLFTEKAYRFLSKFFDELGNKLTGDLERSSSSGSVTPLPPAQQPATGAKNVIGSPS